MSCGDTIFCFSNENTFFHFKLYFNEDNILGSENVDVRFTKFEQVVSRNKMFLPRIIYSLYSLKNSLKIIKSLYR